MSVNASPHVGDLRGPSVDFRTFCFSSLCSRYSDGEIENAALYDPRTSRHFFLVEASGSLERCQYSAAAMIDTHLVAKLGLSLFQLA